MPVQNFKCFTAPKQLRQVVRIHVTVSPRESSVPQLDAPRPAGRNQDAPPVWD
nr:hypothetical protein [Aeromicrobium sp. 9AM]